MSKKFLTAIFALMLPLIFIAASMSEAEAQGRCRQRVGYCPSGTCAKDGSKYACNVKNCSKKNCR